MIKNVVSTELIVLIVKGYTTENILEYGEKEKGVRRTMLIEKNRQNRTKTIYECDRCGDMITMQDNVRIFIQKFNDKVPKKRWDLCRKCYKMLVKGIEKR